MDFTDAGENTLNPNNLKEWKNYALKYDTYQKA